MKRALKRLQELFEPAYLLDINFEELEMALANTTIRHRWMDRLIEDIKQLNLQIDRQLLSGADLNLSDLCARRRTYQDVLESLASIRRSVMKERPNPRAEAAFVDLDRVTV